MEGFKSVMYTLGNFIRAMVRPFFLVAIVVIVGWAVYSFISVVVGMAATDKLTGEQLVTIWGDVWQFVTTIGAAAVAWWFADRKGSKTDSTGS